MPTRTPGSTGGGDVSPGDANWATIFDEDFTSYPTTDLLASATYTTNLGDLWDVADARTGETNMTSLGFVNGSGLHVEQDGVADREWFHQRNFAAACSAASWTPAVDDEIVMALQQDAAFSGSGFTTIFFALRSTAKTKGFTIMRYWTTSALKGLFANDGTSTDSSTVGARSAGLVIALRARRGLVQMYVGSSWPTGGDVTGMTSQGTYGDRGNNPVDILDPTASDLEAEISMNGNIATDFHIQRWGLWVRRG